MVVCPSCGSSRIRNDYRPAPLILRVIGLRALLCDNCNRQFRAFSPAPPRTRALRSTTRRLNGSHQTARSLNLATRPLSQNLSSPSRELPGREQIKLELEASRLFLSIESNQDPQIKVDLTGFVSSRSERSESQPLNGNGSHVPIPHDLRTEIAKLQDVQSMKEAPGLNGVNGRHKTSITCPECGSNWVRRRQRSGLERVIFAITDHKAFICRSCDASFYTRIDEEKSASNLIESSRSAQT
jgi:transposase-like protein